MADSIYQGCKKYGYELNIFIHDRADNMMANILGRRIDGAIILNDHVGEKEVKLLLENETPVVFIDSAERLNGFRDVLKKAGITLEEDYILKGEYEREIAYNSVKDFLELAKPLPEAIFAVNDLSAIGTIEALEEEGIRVPEQVNPISSSLCISEIYLALVYCEVVFSCHFKSWIEVCKSCSSKNCFN